MTQVARRTTQDDRPQLIVISHLSYSGDLIIQASTGISESNFYEHILWAKKGIWNSYSAMCLHMSKIFLNKTFNSRLANSVKKSFGSCITHLSNIFFKLANIHIKISYKKFGFFFFVLSSTIPFHSERVIIAALSKLSILISQFFIAKIWKSIIHTLVLFGVFLSVRERYS